MAIKSSITPIKLLLADDHLLMREGIRSTLSSYPQIRIIGEAARGDEVIPLALQLKPDIILLDINMPGLNGLDVMRRIQTMNTEIKVIALTMYDTKEYVLQFIRSGGRGYVLKDTSPEDLVRAIE